MALSVLQRRNGPEWPLGAIVVSTAGTPVGIMSLVDANNTNAPETPSNRLTSEYTTTCRSIWFQGYHPGANNNGMVLNSGNVYVTVNDGNGNPGNRTNSGTMVMVVPPGSSAPLPDSLGSAVRFSPYKYSIDVDTNGDGALVTLIGPMGQ